MTEEKVDLPTISTKEKIKKFFSNPKVSFITQNAYSGFLIYLILFVIGQVVVSGGKSEREPYFVILMVIFLIASQILLISRNTLDSTKRAILSGVVVTVTIALLDFLVVNLWLEKNNLTLYKYWPTYFIYLSALLTPLVRSNWTSIRQINLKPLLTKKR